MKTLLNIRAFLASIGLLACLLPLGLRAAPSNILPIDTNPVTAAEYRVVGVTTTTMSGAAAVETSPGHYIYSYAAMNKLCQDEVNQESRVATAKEWVHFRGDASKDFGEAWLDPGDLTLLYLPDETNGDYDWLAMVKGEEGRTAYYKPDPISALQDQSCGNYHSPQPTVYGLVGYGSGNVVRVSCANELPVACAALVAVRIRQ